MASPLFRTSQLSRAEYAGLALLMDSSASGRINSSNLDADDIQADIEGEQETLPDLLPSDFQIPEISEDDGNAFLPSEWKKTIAGASKAVTDRTESEYQRLGNACVAFLISKKLIVHRDEFLCAKPSSDAALFIVMWIMNECDTITLDGKPAAGNRSSYSQAQKMHASMTYMFGRLYGAGSQAWHVDCAADGQPQNVVGNPSISQEVSTYMMSLRCRKAQNGEAPTSARAITPEIMALLYDYNHRPENFDIQEFRQRSRKEARENKDQWAGPILRRAAQAIYTIAFICLLRVDEVLKIQADHVKFLGERIGTGGTGKYRMVLTLPFRKTHQFGDIKPFVLHALSEQEAHLCPVRAMAEWISASKITSGHLFRRMVSGDRPSQTDSPMTSQQFLEMFKQNLIDVGVNPAPYGTHSFRRGGCQYLASDRRWTLRRICDWGGWSTEFSNLTIVKYLISWNDNPTETREDFFDPDRAPATKCFQCGRSCHCA